MDGRLSNFLTASGIEDETQKRALLLYQAGSQVREIFRQLNQYGTCGGLPDR
jgi:hypothetical protein